MKKNNIVHCCSISYFVYIDIDIEIDTVKQSKRRAISLTPLPMRDLSTIEHKKGGRIKINLKDWGTLGDREDMKMRDKDSGNANLQGSTRGGKATERAEQREVELSGMVVNWKR